MQWCLAASLTAAMVYPQLASAWTPAGEVSPVREIVTFAEPTPDVVIFRVQSGNYCYVDKSDIPLFREIVAQLYAAQSAGKQVSVHCYDATTSFNGYSAGVMGSHLES